MLQTIPELILGALTGDTVVYASPYETPYHFVRRFRAIEKQQYDNAVWKLKHSGRIKVVIKNNKKFLKCTKKGQLQILLKKAGIETSGKWDGKWRLITFDIPEAYREKRALFRDLLKRNNFVFLQASVFISPYPLNAEALGYLEKSGLIDFVRIFRVDKMDNDKKLRIKFNL
jgi:phenylacetic acid degradation operon negative regulatory protein